MVLGALAESGGHVRADALAIWFPVVIRISDDHLPSPICRYLSYSYEKRLSCSSTPVTQLSSVMVISAANIYRLATLLISEPRPDCPTVCRDPGRARRAQTDGILCGMPALSSTSRRIPNSRSCPRRRDDNLAFSPLFASLRGALRDQRPSTYATFSPQKHRAELIVTHPDYLQRRIS